MNFRTLYKLGTLLREDLLAEPFGTERGDFFTVIASIDQIEASGRRLLTFVEDLLDIGRVASGEHTVTIGPLPLRFAVERALVQRVELTEVETLTMSRLTRLFTYAAASWMASLSAS
jgi:signal transduction histidine kinase